MIELAVLYCIMAIFVPLTLSPKGVPLSASILIGVLWPFYVFAIMCLGIGDAVRLLRETR